MYLRTVKLVDKGCKKGCSLFRCQHLVFMSADPPYVLEKPCPGTDGEYWKNTVLVCRKIQPREPQHVTGLVWSATHCRVMRRQALLDCLTTMTVICKNVWARSSAFQAIDAAWSRKELFCQGQQEHVQRLHDFVQQTRATVLKVRLQRISAFHLDMYSLPVVYADIAHASF